MVAPQARKKRKNENLEIHLKEDKAKLTWLRRGSPKRIMMSPVVKLGDEQLAPMTTW